MAKARDRNDDQQEAPEAREPDRPLSALDRMIQQAIGEGRELGSDSDPSRDQFPRVWEWMSRIYIGRDRVRTPSTMSIRLTPTGVAVGMVDRDLSISVNVACNHLAEALLAMETALASANPPINSFGKREPQLRKRQPKT